MLAGDSGFYAIYTADAAPEAPCGSEVRLVPPDIPWTARQRVAHGTAGEHGHGGFGQREQRLVVLASVP